MPRKPSEKTTEKKFSAVPPKAIIASPLPVKTELKAAAVAEKIEAAPITAARPPEIASTIAALRNADADIARDAATSLATFKDAAAVEPLIEVLGNRCGYFHSVVRAAAAESLGSLGDKRAIEPLLAALTDRIAEVSSESIRALSRFNDPQVIDALSDVVGNQAGFFLPIARRAAVFGLAKLGGDRAAEILRSVAADEHEDSTIRSNAETKTTKQATASAK